LARAPLHDLYAACSLGVEEALAGEIRDLGAKEVRVGRGGVNFRGDERTLYDALLKLRSATRVQRLIAYGPVRDARDLLELAASVDWRAHLARGQTFACDATVRDSCFNHSGYAGLVVKDGVVDRLRAETGDRPDVDAERPDLRIKVLVRGDEATLWRDESGDSLHKRGYRASLAKSPLNEALAAGLLLLSGYDGSAPLADPMCGSGTFAIEAAMIASRRAPGLLGRGFAVEKRPDFDGILFAERRGAAVAEILDRIPVSFEGTDRQPGAVALARRDAEAAGVGAFCTFERAEAAERVPENGAKLVFTNPPYGVRLDEGGDPAPSWYALGVYLRRLPGSVAYVLCGAPELARHAGMKASRRFPVWNGPLECRLLRYDVFDGPRPVRAPRDEEGGAADAPPSAEPPADLS
jgi:putative N6-adenine-specific DNA methylase